MPWNERVRLIQPLDYNRHCSDVSLLSFSHSLANHGYVNRTGIITMDEVVQGALEAFNMGTDFGGFLSLFQIYHSGDL